MMDKILFDNFENNLSDIETKDGSLECAYNFHRIKTAIAAAYKHKCITDIPNNMGVPVYIHQVQNNKNIFFLNENNLIVHKFQNNSVGELILTFTLPDGANNISSIDEIGNTVVFTTDNNDFIRMVFKDGSYIVLDKTPPPINLQIQPVFRFNQYPKVIATTGEIVVNSTPGYEVDGLLEEYNYLNPPMGFEYKKETEDTIHACLNSLIADCTAQHRFCFPVLIRACYRMFDGSDIMMTPPLPVFLNTEHFIVPLVGKDGDGKDRVVARSGAYKLYFNFIEVPEDWKDLISSVDIYISKPIFTYKQDGKYLYATDKNLSCFDTGLTPDEDSSVVGERRFIRMEPVDVKREILETSTFYRVRRISKDEKRTNFETQEEFLNSLPPDYLAKLDVNDRAEDFKLKYYNNLDTLIDPSLNLENIEQLPQLKDSFRSSYFNTAEKVDNINGRVHAINLGYKRKVSERLPIKINTYITHPSSPKTFILKPLLINNAFAQIASPYLVKYIVNGEVKKTWDSTITSYHEGIDPKADYYTSSEEISAVSAEVAMVKNDEYFISEIPVIAHDFLNLTIFDYSLSATRKVTTEEFVAFTQQDNEECYNISPDGKSLTAFDAMALFARTLGNTINTKSRIISLVSYGMEISPGQFGEYRFYLFTENGIAVAKVGDDGSLLSHEEILPLTLLNEKSYVQTKAGVVFVTEGGLYIINGQQHKEIITFDFLKNEVTAKFPEIAHFAPVPDFDWVDYIKNAQLFYDRERDNVFIYKKQTPFLITYNVNTGFFSVNSWQIDGKLLPEHLNYYYSQQKLFDAKTKGDSIKNQFLLTKPFHLKASGFYKTINELMVRGEFKKGNIQLVLYGSNDLLTWKVITSSTDNKITKMRGTPCKYHRLAVIGNLSQNEYIYSMIVDFTMKYNNKIR